MLTKLLTILFWQKLPTICLHTYLGVIFIHIVIFCLFNLILWQNIPESLTARLLNMVVLDVHSNQLRSLPNSIGCLSRLKLLNVSGNLIQNLPKTIENCRLYIHLFSLFLVIKLNNYICTNFSSYKLCLNECLGNLSFFLCSPKLKPFHLKMQL